MLILATFSLSQGTLGASDRTADTLVLGRVKTQAEKLAFTFQIYNSGAFVVLSPPTSSGVVKNPQEHGAVTAGNLCPTLPEVFIQKK